LLPAASQSPVAVVSLGVGLSPVFIGKKGMLRRGELGTHVCHQTRQLVGGGWGGGAAKTCVDWLMTDDNILSTYYSTVEE
jgi:hypothetical protein